ncbi:hypothetical protein HELRODRAFT_165039 [Helobdella robusta]|uniref:Endonuclease/exonuclease/phosphatase domain-containing protein n=1 Tax=Helobdella robusta TaxID=6412 RepID=T1EW63_HELRO|nr:hypothetical protein HELRODRAFT_165039 [Helobdella robusta]ESN92903.1 hypothetical protein HELRODRAFT_165039 [Helobdella robusta]
MVKIHQISKIGHYLLSLILTVYLSSQKKKKFPIPWKTLNGQGVTISRKYATVEGCCEKSGVPSWNIRLGTLNTGSLTGRSMEIIDMLEKRKVDICSLQETRWTSNGVSLIGSYKLFWNGQKTDQNRIGIIIRESLAKIMGKQVLTVFSAYAPQTGESEVAKNDFWNTLSDAVRKTPSSEIPLICGDSTAMLEIKQMGRTFDHI